MQIIQPSSHLASQKTVQYAHSTYVAAGQCDNPFECLSKAVCNRAFIEPIKSENEKDDI